MPTLVSPGVSVTVTNESYYIPATASTVPLMFIATRADKKQADGITAAAGAAEHSIVRTMTSLNQSISSYGVPYFRTDNTGAQLHGDARNEYGLFALNQALTVLSTVYVVRANVDLADADVITYSSSVPVAGVNTGTGSVTSPIVNQVGAVDQLWTFVALSSTSFSVSGIVSGSQVRATVGTPYNNGIISFTINAGSTPFIVGDSFTFSVTHTTAPNPLGVGDAAKRSTIVTALRAEINNNQDVRSEIYEYNLILCPGYYEVANEMLNLTLAINEEALVIADTPFDKSPEDVAIWSGTSARQNSQNIAYYYPHSLASNLDGVIVFAAASGTALKTIAYSDDVSEVWYPPAGLRRGLVTGVSDVGYVTGTLGTATTFVSTPLNQGQRDILYQTALATGRINIIPMFPGKGIVVFGQKTSSPVASAMDRINVIRLLMLIKRDIRKASMVYLFELNDRITQESIKQMVDNYLNDIMLRRGLYDYVVVCDASNNTPARIDRNELHVDLAIKPEKAVEFIYSQIRVVSTGANI